MKRVGLAWNVVEISARAPGAEAGGRAHGGCRARPRPNLAKVVSRLRSAFSVMRDYRQAIRERVVVFDGGMGATLEQFELTPGGTTADCRASATRR